MLEEALKFLLPRRSMSTLAPLLTLLGLAVVLVAPGIREDILWYGIRAEQARVVSLMNRLATSAITRKPRTAAHRRARGS